MKMKRMLSLLIVLCFCLMSFAGCGGGKNDPDTDPVTDEYCYIAFDDGEDHFEVELKEYGEEIVLPETINDTASGTFLGWIGPYGLYQPGDTVVSEDLMSFSALRSNPDFGLVLTLDTVKGGYSLSSCEEETVSLYTPYEESDFSEEERYFDHWTDEEGNVYEGRSPVRVEKGDVLILTSVYSTDLSGAFKVNVHFNTGDEYFDLDFFRYIKRGEAIPLWLTIQPADLTFEGWYDDPEGGNFLCGEDEMFTPSSDIDVYAHWTEE